jgi:hypothetical protein
MYASRSFRHNYTEEQSQTFGHSGFPGSIFQSDPDFFHCFRTLKHLLATGACQVQSEDAYYSHLVLRLMGCFVLFYTACVVFKGWATMKDMVFSLKHYWCFVDLEALQLHAPSWRLDRKVA